jgi:hypothetical protein
MGRAAAQYVFAALLALLTAQAVVPCTRVERAAIVWCAESEQRVAEETRPARSFARQPVPTPSYRSRTAPEPVSNPIFQRPPPQSSLF